MKLLIFALAAVIILTILKKILDQKVPSKTFQYRLNKSLLTPAERSFYGVLKQAVGNDFDIFSKVRVADVFLPQKGYSKSEWQRAFNKISGKHFDFLLSSKNDTSVKCCIELNDKSHNSSKRGLRDQFLNEICQSNGLPLMQFAAQSSYNIQELRDAICENLGVRKNIKEIEG
jgi:hypothetical protein